MVTRIFLLVILMVTAFSLLGCETAKGLKEDVQFIGDKTYEIVDK
jgi:predicted small secreted protein